MHNSYIVTGRTTDAHTATLDEDLPLPPERVWVRVELLPSLSQRPYRDVMKVIRERQVRRNHQPKSRDAVDEYLRQERASWDQQCVSIWIPDPSSTPSNNLPDFLPSSTNA
ncbi:MAG: hypothetical protein HYX63_02575 [Gammaproteobacteria bacterium]|nr:hypothetical protein [Gammaproteobacteria bacterium]